MNTKKLTVILIAIGFSLVVLFSCVGLLSIKKVDVNYSVSADANNASEVQKSFDKFLDKNLMFLDLGFWLIPRS